MSYKSTAESAAATVGMLLALGCGEEVTLLGGVGGTYIESHIPCDHQVLAEVDDEDARAGFSANELVQAAAYQKEGFQLNDGAYDWVFGDPAPVTATVTIQWEISGPIQLVRFTGELGGAQRESCPAGDGLLVTAKRHHRINVGDVTLTATVEGIVLEAAAPSQDVIFTNQRAYTEEIDGDLQDWPGYAAMSLTPDLEAAVLTYIIPDCADPNPCRDVNVEPVYRLGYAPMNSRPVAHQVMDTGGVSIGWLSRGGTRYGSTLVGWVPNPRL